MTHTEWHVDANDDRPEVRWVEDDAGQTVCDFYFVGLDNVAHEHPNAEDHAKQIVTDHNSHDGLLEALEEAEPIIRALHEEVRGAVPALLLARIQTIIKAAQP